MNTHRDLAAPPPRLSVVIASKAGGEFLFRCVASFAEAARRLDVELIVADRCGEPTRERLRARHPEVRVVPWSGAGRASVPELRAAGVDAARGERVAVIEEHCVARPGWLEAILEGFAAGDVAIGGPILDSDFERVRDWVVYFSEYHNYLPPWPAGERTALNGANAAYLRERLLAHRAALGSGYWEVALHPALAAEGRLRAVPGMQVCHTGPFDYGYYLRQRMLLSRVWGGTQREHVSPALRLAHLAAAPLLPLFLLARIARRAGTNARLRGRLLRALPLLVPVVLAYTWGETLGYLIGPGRALEEVE